MARVLFVDDDLDLLAAVASLLQAAGHHVTVTSNGADALCLLTVKPPHDVLILDIVMPGLDGHQLLKELGPSAPPVIISTGDRVDPCDFQTGKIVRVLSKPFQPEDLIEAINDALWPKCVQETTEAGRTVVAVPPALPMTEEQREKAHARFRRMNGGAHAAPG
jgi:CheY-like chemotaxis protein